MAGFEIVVRPVVFPNIRPTPKQSVPTTTDDPEKGLAVITGSSGRSIDLPYSWSVSTSESRQTENQRRVDVARVYQKDDEDTVNRDNFVDIEVANKVWMRGGGLYYYSPVKESDNIEIQEHNVIRKPDE